MVFTVQLGLKVEQPEYCFHILIIPQLNLHTFVHTNDRCYVCILTVNGVHSAARTESRAT